MATGQGPAFVDESWWKHLWIVFIFAAATAALLAGYLYVYDRPYPPGHCRNCGYLLTGNVTGVCPECGTRA